MKKHDHCDKDVREVNHFLEQTDVFANHHFHTKTVRVRVSWLPVKARSVSGCREEVELRSPMPRLTSTPPLRRPLVITGCGVAEECGADMWRKTSLSGCVAGTKWRKNGGSVLQYFLATKIKRRSWPSRGAKKIPPKKCRPEQNHMLEIPWKRNAYQRKPKEHQVIVKLMKTRILHDFANGVLGLNKKTRKVKTTQPHTTHFILIFS